MCFKSDVGYKFNLRKRDREMMKYLREENKRIKKEKVELEELIKLKNIERDALKEKIDDLTDDIEEMKGSIYGKMFEQTRGNNYGNNIRGHNDC